MTTESLGNNFPVEVSIRSAGKERMLWTFSITDGQLTRLSHMLQSCVEEIRDELTLEDIQPVTTPS